MIAKSILLFSYTARSGLLAFYKSVMLPRFSPEAIFFGGGLAENFKIGGISSHFGCKVFTLHISHMRRLPLYRHIARGSARALRAECVLASGERASRDSSSSFHGISFTVGYSGSFSLDLREML